ncbi:MAG: protein kinase domain-containing protein [Candidatus Sumerlaeaceae bacterium]
MTWLHEILGRYYEKRQEYARAASFFEKAQDLSAQARVLEKGGQLLEAMRLYAELGAYRDAARTALQAGDAAAAASFYRRGGDNEAALRVLLDHGAITDAVALLVELDRKCEAAEVAERHGDLRRAAALYLDLGQEQKAIELLRKLNDLRALLSVYLKRGDLQAAAEECRRANQLALAASLFEQTGLYAEAAQLLEDCGEWFRAGELYEKAEQFEKAGAAYEKAERVDLAVTAYTRATGCELRAAQLYEDLVELQSKQQWQFEAPVVAIALASRAEAAALALRSGRLFYTSRQFQQLWQWRPEGEFSIREVALSADGNALLAVLDSATINVGQFQLVLLDQEKKLLHAYTGPEPFRGITFVTEKSLSHVYCCENQVVWCDAPGRLRWEFQVDFSAWEAVFAPDSETLAVSSLGGTVYILSPEGRSLASRHFEDRVHQLVFSPNSKILGAAVGDQRLIFCCSQTLDVVAETHAAEPVRHLGILPGTQDSFIVCGEHIVELVKVGKGRSVVFQSPTRITTLHVDPLDFAIYITTDEALITKYQVKDCKLLAAEWYAKGQELVRAAELFEEAGKYEQAYELFRQLGDYERAASNIQRVGDTRTAARHYEIVGKYERAALLYEEMGEIPRAAKCYANARQPLRAAELYEQLGETLLAAEFYEQAGKFRQAGYLFRQLEQLERSVENWERHRQSQPDDSGVAFDLAKIYAETARYNEAIKVLQSIQDVPEYRRDVLRLMAECFIEKGLYEVAADRLLEALGPQWKCQRDNLQLVYDLASAYERAGRLEEAKELYSKILAVDYCYRDVLQKLERTRERITASRDETQMAAVAARSSVADPFAATISGKVDQESLRYKIVRKLGQGGMGVVYLALDTRLGRYVAWKVLPAHLAGNPEFQRRLLQEACAIAQVAHPHIVAVYDVVTNPNECFLTMEYVDGPSLRSLLSREKVLSLDRALRYAWQMASALGAAHQAHIIHRDVKPENVMIASALDAVKMVDFGLARLAEDAKVTREGCVVGTVSYMAPEQIMGNASDGRADLYALGIVLFEILAGRPPFIGENVLAQHLHVPPPSLSDLVPDVPLIVAQFVQRCLAKNPDERPADAQSAAAELEEIQKELSTRKTLYS